MHPALGQALGFGRKTGIDLTSERPGLVPDRKLARRRLRGATRVREKGRRCSEGTQAALYECGGVERGWSTGDNVNLAVGQGDLQATPLQVAVAYSALANNGTIVDTAPRQGDRGRQRRHGPGAALQAAPQGQDQPARPPDRARRPARRRQRRGRHVGRRLQGLPVAVHRSTARPAPPSASPTPTSRGTRASSRTAGGRSSSS